MAGFEPARLSARESKSRMSTKFHHTALDLLGFLKMTKQTSCTIVPSILYRKEVCLEIFYISEWTWKDLNLRVGLSLNRLKVYYHRPLGDTSLFQGGCFGSDNLKDCC